jgi:hypothetical protein
MSNLDSMLKRNKDFAAEQSAADTLKQLASVQQDDDKDSVINSKRGRKPQPQ